MKDRIRGLMSFLGLVEDEYSEYDRTGDVRDFEPEPAVETPRTPPRPVRRPAPATPERPRPVPRPAGETVRPVPGSEGVRPKVAVPSSRTVSPFSAERDIAVLTLTSYDETLRITSILRENRAVVLHLAAMDDMTRRRCVDFASGVAHTLNAKIEKLGQRGNFVIVPPTLPIGPGVIDRLRQQY